MKILYLNFKIISIILFEIFLTGDPNYAFYHVIKSSIYSLIQLKDSIPDIYGLIFKFKFKNFFNNLKKITSCLHIY